MKDDKKQEYDDPEQSAKFIEFAKQISDEESEERFEEAMKRIAKAKRNRTEERDAS